MVWPWVTFWIIAGDNLRLATSDPGQSGRLGVWHQQTVSRHIGTARSLSVWIICLDCVVRLWSVRLWQRLIAVVRSEPHEESWTTLLSSTAVLSYLNPSHLLHYLHKHLDIHHVNNLINLSISRVYAIYADCFFMSYKTYILHCIHDKASVCNLENLQCFVHTMSLLCNVHAII